MSDAPPVPRALPCVLVLLLAAGGLCGCVELEETWDLDEEGGGTYALVLRWNADLWRRVGDVLGPAVMKRLEGRELPLRPEDWREGLEGLPGVTVLELGDSATDTGMRELRVRLRFEHLTDLLRWELMSRRTVRVRVVPAPGAPADAAPTCHFYMEPLARVPVLDRVAELLAALESPPPAAEGGAAGRDPPPLERLGIDRAAGELVWNMVKPQLEGVALVFRLRPPNDLRELRGRSVPEGTREARFEFDFPALRKTATDRTLDFAWALRAFDKAPLAEQAGDRDPRAARPDGRTR